MMRNHCNTLSARHYTGGKNNLIADLLRAGSHRVETWGNSREGFSVFLLAGPPYDSGVEIGSGRYTRRGDADAAIRRAYGTDVRVYRGRNWPA